MILNQARETLTELFDPLPIDRFFDELMGKAVFDLLDGKGRPRRYLLGHDPAQTILAASATHSGKIGWHAEAPSGPPPPAPPVDSPAAFLARIRGLHERGYTVRVPDVTALSPALYRVTRALEFMLHQPVKVSLFWSGAAARAPIHYDGNDNIVIQLVGHKEWAVATAPSSLHNVWRDVGETPPLLGDHRTVLMKPGDLLYLPRGTPHAVGSLSESLHLSILFTPVTLREAVIAALDHISDHDRTLREGVLGRIDAGPDLAHLAQTMDGTLQKLLRAMRSPGFLGSALSRRAARSIEGMDKLPVSPRQAPVSPASVIRQRPLAMCYMLATQDKIDLQLPGEHVIMHRGAEPALRFIAATPSFRVEDLPGGLADEVKMALVERLIGAGFLEVAD